MWNNLWKKLFVVLFALGLIGGVILPVMAEEPSPTDAILESYLDDNYDNSLGGIPQPEDLDFSTPEDIANNDLTFPERFDLRDSGLVSPVRQQNPYGTCWSFGAMASMENSYLSRDPHIDNSEAHLAWFNYSGSDAFKPFNIDDIYNEGGNVYMVAATLAKNWGIATEDTVPYSLAGSPLDESLRGEKSYELARVDFLSNYAWDADQDEMIKRALIDNEQVITVAFNADSEYLNEATGAFNAPESRSNHIVACVGWDDNYPKENFNENNRPSKNGAWIIKNSWGLNAGDSGYYYISYEDKSVIGWSAFTMDIADSNETAYVHDELGMYTQIGKADTEKGANIYTPKTANEALSAVGIYAPDSEVDYKLTIYKDLTDANNPESGTLAYSQEGHLYSPGYSKLELEHTVPLNGQNPYSLVIEFTAIREPDNGLLPIEMKVEEGFYANAKNAPGESFAYDPDTLEWIDFTNLGNPAIMNLCLQGYTVPEDTVRFSLGSGQVKTRSLEHLSAKDGQAIHYTIDGSDPSLSSPTYDERIGIDVTDVSLLKAAVSNGAALGPIHEASYEKATADVSSLLITDSTNKKFYYDLDKVPGNLPELLGQTATFVDITPISTGSVSIDGQEVASNTSIRIPFDGELLEVPVAITEEGKVSKSYQLSFEEEEIITYDYVGETLESIKDDWVIADVNARKRINPGESITSYIASSLTAYNGDYQVTISLPQRPEAPESPIVSDVSLNEISLQPISNGEYRVGDGTWQEEPLFTNLQPDTTYLISQRYRGVVGTSFTSEERQTEVRTLIPNSGNTDTDKEPSSKGTVKIPKTGNGYLVLIGAFILLSGSLLVLPIKKERR